MYGVAVPQGAVYAAVRPPSQVYDESAYDPGPPADPPRKTAPVDKHRQEIPADKHRQPAPVERPRPPVQAEKPRQYRAVSPPR